MRQEQFQHGIFIFLLLGWLKTGSCYKTGYLKASSVLSQYSFIKILRHEKQVLQFCRKILSCMKSSTVVL